MYSVGTIIGGKYRLDEMVGQGGMASVWRAVHVDLERDVAVKLLSTRGPDQEEQKQRFLAEARVAAKVRHRNVVDIIDFGVHDGQPYIVMELLVGMDLAERITDGPALAVPEFLRLISLSLGGLAAVHDAGIVHRDMKPENVYLVEDSDGVFPKLLDFGISRMAPGARRIGSAIPTEDGVIVGTPEYMAPEQARGLRNIDKRADLYSMAVVIYEVLTGRLPFWSENVGDLIVMITTGSAPTLAALRPELGQPLSDALERAMARNPEQRFGSAREMRRALMEAAEKTAEVSNTWASAMTTRAGIGSSRRIEIDEQSRELSGAFSGNNLSTAPPPAPLQPVSRDSLPSRKLLPARAWAALAAFSLIGGLAYFGSASLDSDSSEELVEVESDNALTKVQDSEVTVELEGLPANAVVRLDGQPVQSQPLRIPRDEALHDIEVEIAGMQPWRIKHRASSDGAYRVLLAPVVAPTAVAEPIVDPSAGRASTSMRARPTPAMARPRPRSPAPSTSMMGGLFRSPGF